MKEKKNSIVFILNNNNNNNYNYNVIDNMDYSDKQ